MCPANSTGRLVSVELFENLSSSVPHTWARILQSAQGNARGRPVEQQNQLRWRDRIHLRRLGRHPGPGHLQEVLRPADERVSPWHLLHIDGTGGPRSRIPISGGGAGPVGAPCSNRGSVYFAELHNNSEHRIPGDRFLIVVRFLRTGGPEMLRMM